MKQHTSVFMLMARSTIYRVLGLLIVMAAAEAGLFWLRIQQGVVDGSFHLEGVIALSKLTWACAAGFQLVTALLFWGCYTVSHSYTAARLSVSNKTVFLWQCIYNAACYLLFWAVAAASVLGMCAIHGALCDRGPQSVFLAFHSNRTLHALIPFEEYSFLIRNLLYLLVMSLVTAQYPMIQRQGSKNYFYLMTAAIVCLRFPGRTGNFGNNLVDIVLSAIILLAVGWWVYGKEVDVDVPSA